ncbi:MAG: hypothetical protein FJ279_12850, partial [Planctomycetes bacterium]|nr:hypothetical protein [Planctomycetota bacterium]
MDKPPSALGRAVASTSLNLFVLFLASFLVRRAWVNDGLFEHDSVKLAQAMEATYETGRLQPVEYFADKVGGRHGLVLVNLPLYAGYRAITGRVSSEHILLVSAALFGSLAVCLLYLIVERLRFGVPPLGGVPEARLKAELQTRRLKAELPTGLPTTAAFGAGLMFSASPIFLSVSTGAKDHALSAFLAALAMSLLLGARTRGGLVAASAALGLGPLVRDTNVSLVLPYALAFVWLRRGERRAQDVACAFAPAVVMIALAMWLQREWLAAMVGYHTFRGVWSAQTPMALGALSRGFGLIGWALVVCGLVELRRRWGWAAIAVMAAWFLPEFI